MSWKLWMAGAVCLAILACGGSGAAMTRRRTGASAESSLKDTFAG